MAVTVYRSTDASAPVLTGSVGDLVNLLDKCLVAGYGAKSAAGWSKPFTAANKAVFQMGAGIGMYLDVDDSGPGGGLAKEARIRGYETMTAVGTGTGPFPTVAQLAGPNVRKSATADATARPWIVVADARTFYLFVQAGDTAGAWWGVNFGEVYSLGGSGDAYRCQICARGTENTATAASDALPFASSLPTSTIAGHYIPRAYTGLGASKQNCKTGSVLGWSGASGLLGGRGSVPNGTDGKLYFSPILMGDGDTLTVRGRLRGLYEPGFLTSGFADQDTVAGEGALAGRTILLFKNLMQSVTNAGLAIDITGPWETN